MDLSGIVAASMEFAKTHHNVTCFVLFMWAFVETGLLMGLVFPAEKILIAGSVMVSQKVISPHAYVGCVTGGTFLGYTVTYFMGYFFGEEVLIRLFDKFKVDESFYRRVREFIDSKGELSLLIGRFFAIVRPILPFVIGAFGASFLKFSVFNIVGALLWSLTYLFIGDLIGRAISIIISGNLASVLGLIVVVLLGLYVLRRFYVKNR